MEHPSRAKTRRTPAAGEAAQNEATLCGCTVCGCERVGGAKLSVQGIELGAVLQGVVLLAVLQGSRLVCCANHMASVRTIAQHHSLGLIPAKP